MMAMYSTSSGVIGQGKEDFLLQADAKAVPPLQLTQHKTPEELDADELLRQNPPRAIAPRSVRYATKGGLTEAQLKMVRRLDDMAQAGDVLARREGGTDNLGGPAVVINIPVAAQVLQLSEELLRAKALSLPGARLIRERTSEAGKIGSLNGVAMSEASWDAALTAAHGGE